VRERSGATIAPMTISRSRDIQILAGAAGVSGLVPFAIGRACLLVLTTPNLQRRSVHARVQS
jgi:hypothetical protein